MKKAGVLCVALSVAIAMTGCNGNETEETVTVEITKQRIDTELIVNGAFSNGSSGWYLGQWGGSSNGTVSSGQYRLSVNRAGSEWWHVQFMQQGIPLEQGKKYLLSFDAYKSGSGTQTMQVNVGEDGGDYTSYFEEQGEPITLTTTPTSYQITFEMTEPSDPSARVEFNCGMYAGTYYIDNVSLKALVEEGAYLTVSDTAVDFGALSVDGTGSKTVSLNNSGTDAVNWSVDTSASWLSLSPTSGTIASGDSVILTIDADADGLPLGIHTREVEIVHDADNLSSPVIVDVEMKVSNGYEPASPYLVDPSLAIDFVEDIAAFRTKSRDDVHGGFYTYINRQGNPLSTDEKSLCGQSRLGYAFTRAFMLTGDETYLDHAHHALKFLYDYGFNNGWYFVTDIDGNYKSHWGHNNWWSFQQHYALVGIAAMVEATGGDLDWQDGSQSDATWLETGLTSNYNHLWDSGSSSGYFNYASTDWSSRWGKGFAPTVDAITTHAFLVAAMTDDSLHDARLNQLADNIVDHMVSRMTTSAAGFPEAYDSAWQVDTGNTKTEVGHLYKTSWVLQRAYLMDKTQTEFNEAAQDIMWDIWDNGGYDKVHGGPYSALNWQTGVISNTNKNNWMMEQGVTAGLINYYLAENQSDKDMYLEVADGSLMFFMDHIIDPVYGEAYSDVSADGSAIVTGDKGGLFSSGYHSIELGYYVYLYGNLYYHHRPVSLYYKFPAGDAREMALKPLAIEDDVLRIVSVEKDGAPYTDFDSMTRTLSLPQGVGGVFKVTFAVDDLCGDGSCDNGETCDSCESDCGVCDYCGDGSCDNGETCDSCESDCGVCPSCDDGIQNQDEMGVDCGGVCSPCNAVGCTCPQGCDAVQDKTVPFVVNGIGNKCYFFQSLGNYLNNWNNINVNLNGNNITNKYLGWYDYPTKIDGGYYLYYNSNVPWGHLEVK